MLRHNKKPTTSTAMPPTSTLLDNGTIVTSSTSSSFKAKPYGRFLKIVNPGLMEHSYTNYYNDSDDYIQRLNNDDINKNYEGFCIDLLKIIAEKIGFEYRIELVPDGKYGVKLSTGEWNGIVRQLIDKVKIF